MIAIGEAKILGDFEVKIGIFTCNGLDTGHVPVYSESIFNHFKW